MEISHSIPLQVTPQSSSQFINQNKNLNEDFSLQEIEKFLDQMQLQQNNNYSLNVQTSLEIESAQNKLQVDLQRKSSKKQPLSLNDVSVNRDQIAFGENNLFPGSIQELDFCVALNKQQNGRQPHEKDSSTENNQLDNSYILRIIVKCSNQEFEDLDQYVFSVRSNNCYDYYEEVRFKIKRGERADVKVAVKIPQFRQKYLINGVLEIILGELEPILIPIAAKFTIPQIICLKEMYKQDEQTRVICIPGKKSQQRTPPIPFKNLSPFNLTIQNETISNQSFAEKPYDIISQNLVYCQSDSLFYVNMQIKQNLNFVGQVPRRVTIRKILLMRVKNSSVYFHYPLQVTIFEGSGSDNS